jgi:ABC-type protease/lipase transport system fused ATPase/permease subunit
MKYALSGLIFGISMSVISWIIGMVLNSALVKTKYYTQMSNFNFIPGKKLNEFIGIKYFKWIVKNTFFKFFNQQIKVESKKTDLTEIRNQMTISEISHLIGFVFVTFFAVYKSFSVHIIFGLTMMIGNILLNLYPSLLQQENKRRIDKLINKNTINKY